MKGIANMDFYTAGGAASWEGEFENDLLAWERKWFLAGGEGIGSTTSCLPGFVVCGKKIFGGGDVGRLVPKVIYLNVISTPVCNYVPQLGYSFVYNLRLAVLDPRVCFFWMTLDFDLTWSFPSRA
ncbi:hypothetical protein Tco_0313228 [Tanacetum coccineum]